MIKYTIKYTQAQQFKESVVYYYCVLISFANSWKTPPTTPFVNNKQRAQMHCELNTEETPQLSMATP